MCKQDKKKIKGRLVKPPRLISPLYHPELHEKGFQDWLDVNDINTGELIIPEIYRFYGDYRVYMELQGMSPDIGVTSDGVLEQVPKQLRM